jgi:hypothetical protein
MIPFAYISFTLPGMWLGLLLLGLPILAHLLTRQVRRRRVFPSFQLLQSTVAEQARLRTIRRWLLLALRCLAIAALVAAFVQPVWRADRQEAVAAEQGNAVVLVIDASASMQTLQNGTPRWELAQAAATRLLTDLRRGVDVANVIWATATPTSAYSELSPNLPGLQQEIRAHQASFEHADAASALRLAAYHLRQFAGPKRLVVVSDLQTTDWQSALDDRPLASLPPNTQLTALDLNASGDDNVSLSEPRCEPLRPFVGQSVSLITQVRNHTSRQKQARVTVRVDGQDLTPQTVALDAGQQREVAFTLQLQDGTPRCVEFAIDRDSFSPDDRAFTIVRPQAAISVGVLSDDDWQRVGSASFYLSLALAPHGDRNDRFAVQHMTTRDLQSISPAALAQQVAIFVGYLGQLESAAAEKLAEYVRAGGALVVFCGEGPVRRNLQQLDAEDPNGWLPWQTGARRELQRDGKYTYFQTGRWRSRLLRDFDATSQVALSEIPFGTRWDVTQVHGDAEVLLSFQDGTAALASRGFGAGQVVLANFSPSSESSELGKYGAFVALTQLMAQNLQTATALPSFIHPGQALSQRVPLKGSPSTVELYDPAEQLTSPVRTVLPEAVELQLPRVALPGCHRIRQNGELVDAVAVNLDPRESEMACLPIDPLRGGDVADAATTAGIDSGAWQRPIDLRGRPLWGWCVLLAMFSIGVESSLLAWWRQ